MNTRVTRIAGAALAAACLAGGGAAIAPSAPGRWLLPAEARADEAPKIFHGTGVVTDVDPASGLVTIDHGDIPGFMGAMEMEYNVQPRALTEGLQRGDRIDFGVDGKSSAVVEIRKVANP